MNIQALHELLIAKALKIAVAESCTGGLLAAELTSLPGSSRYMLGGVVAYSNAVKNQILGVPAEVIETYGAVSEEVALAMALGVRLACGSDIGVGITGVAGPDGSEAKQPGLIFLCVALGSERAHQKLTEDTGRDGNRRQAVDAAVQLIGDVASRL